MLKLPKQILYKICVLLDDSDILNLSLTSKQCQRKLLTNNEFWKAKSLYVFGQVAFEIPSKLTFDLYKVLIFRQRLLNFTIDQFEADYWDEDQNFKVKVSTYGFPSYLAFKQTQEEIIKNMTDIKLDFHMQLLTSQKIATYIDHSYEIDDHLGFFFVKLADGGFKTVFKTSGIW